MPNNPAKLSRFTTLHNRIKRNLIEASQDLEEIRDDELYLAGGFKTFSAYCESIGRDYHWGWSMIEAGKMQKEIGIQLPNLAVAKAVRQASPSIPQRRKIVQAALKQNEGVLTVPAIEKAVARLPERRKLESKPVATTRRMELPKDGTGLPIPPEIMDFWNRNEEVNHLLSMISKVRVTLEKAQGSPAIQDPKNLDITPAVPPDKLYKGMDIQGCISKLLSLREEIECAKSYAVCPSCNGVLFETCEACRGRGTISKFHWNNTVPAEIKKLRES